MKNHYSTLGVPKKASQREVVSAYKMLAKKYHPDRNPSASAHERFIEIHEAYSVLKDPGKRHNYDKSLLIKRQPSPTYSASGHSFVYEHPEETISPVSSAIGTPLVLIVSFLGIVFSALVGIVIISAPALLYFVFDFIPGIPVRMFVLISLAIPYWYWLYRTFERIHWR